MIKRAILADLSSYPWFADCGRPPTASLQMHALVASWEEAQQLFTTQEWSDIEAEAQGQLTSHLFLKARSDYLNWNPLVKEARGWVEKNVLPLAEVVQRAHGLDPSFLTCVRWEVMHGIMEQQYLKWRPPSFFATLLTVYRSGHYPCGWVGSWPEGKLAIY